MNNLSNFIFKTLYKGKIIPCVPDSINDSVWIRYRDLPIQERLDYEDSLLGMADLSEDKLLEWLTLSETEVYQQKEGDENKYLCACENYPLLALDGDTYWYHSEYINKIENIVLSYYTMSKLAGEINITVQLPHVREQKTFSVMISIEDTEIVGGEIRFTVKEKQS